MKKSIWFLTAVVAIGILSAMAQARITGTNPTGSSSDAFCVGKSGGESCVTFNGSVVPTTTGVSSLGSTSLRWLTGFITSLTATTITTGSGGVINSAGPIGLAVQTTTQLSVRTDPVGSTFLAQESVAGALVTNAYNLCASTAAAVQSYVYISVSTNSAGATPAVLGAVCNK